MFAISVVSNNKMGVAVRYKILSDGSEYPIPICDSAGLENILAFNKNAVYKFDTQ